MAEKITAIRQRSTREVFEDHLSKRAEGQVEEDIAQNYSEDVIVLSGTGIHLGHEGAQEAADMLDRLLPNANYTYRTKLVKGEYAFLEWSADSEGGFACDGADSFVIRNGLIMAQTLHYTVRGGTPRAYGDDSDLRDDDAEDFDGYGDEAL